MAFDASSVALGQLMLGDGGEEPGGGLDRFGLLILDDLAYVTKDQAETSVLFELMYSRYEQRSILITAN